MYSLYMHISAMSHALEIATARQIYGLIHLQRQQNLTSRSINPWSKGKCIFNYSTNTLFYKDLFLAIINCYNQDFVILQFFKEKFLFLKDCFFYRISFLIKVVDNTCIYICYKICLSQNWLWACVE